MKTHKINKSYQEINKKIRTGEVVVVTAEEIIDIVREEGPVEAARRVDVVTTGTFAPMCSSGAFINFGHAVPRLKASKVWLNNVSAYAGIAAVDCYIGVTEPCEDDPLNKVYPGEFNYGGGHVIQDLVAGKTVYLKATAYGTDCYPSRMLEKEVSLRTLPSATLCNPRNGYQNYNCAVNLTNKTVYTYMGTLKPRAANANFCPVGGKDKQKRSQNTCRHPMGYGRSQKNESQMAHGRQYAGIRVFTCRGTGHSDSHPQRGDRSVHCGIG